MVKCKFSGTTSLNSWQLFFKENSLFCQGREGVPVIPTVRYITSPQPNPLAYRPGWGQDQDSPSQQVSFKWLCKCKFRF